MSYVTAQHKDITILCLHSKIASFALTTAA
jgi:hypothetical protein